MDKNALFFFAFFPFALADKTNGRTELVCRQHVNEVGNPQRRSIMHASKGSLDAAARLLPVRAVGARGQGGGKGGAGPPNFGRSVNPIPYYGADYTRHIIACPYPPNFFSDLPTAL